MNERTARPLTPDEANVVAEAARRFPAGFAYAWLFGEYLTCGLDEAVVTIRANPAAAEYG